MIKNVAAILAVWALFVSAQVSSDELRILGENIAPVNFIEDGQWTGSTAEIVKEILRRLSLSTPIEEIPWARGYKMALEQPNVVLFSMARTPKREKQFQWVGPVCLFRSAFYARRDFDLSVQSLEDARQVKRIGTYRDDVREAYLVEKGFTNLDSTNSNKSNLRKLLSGRIDLWATSNLEAASVPGQYGVDPSAIKHVYTFQEFVLYIALSKATPAHIAEEWQAALDEMKSDGSFMAISRRWLPEDSLPERIIKPSFYNHIEDQLAIYTENSPPANYLENGRLKGPAVRIVQEILKRLSLHTPIEVVPWARGYNLALTKPNVALFSTSRLPQRETLFKWVGPLYTQRWGFYAPVEASIRINTLEEARRVSRIGTYHEDAKEQFLKSLGFSNLISTNNNIGNVRHLMEGSIDLWVSSDFNMPYIVRYAGYDPRKLKLVFSFKTVGNYIAFSRQTPDHIVKRWQKIVDALRRDGTLAIQFSSNSPPDT